MVSGYWVWTCFRRKETTIDSSVDCGAEYDYQLIEDARWAVGQADGFVVTSQDQSRAQWERAHRQYQANGGELSFEDWLSEGMPEDDRNTSPSAYVSGVFTVDNHGNHPSPRPGQQSHHGVMSRYMEEHYEGYDPNLAPAVLMPTSNHQATFGGFNTWRADMKRRMGGTFDWSNVSESDMRRLTVLQFDAADVPQDVRDEYWRGFDAMINVLNR